MGTKHIMSAALSLTVAASFFGCTSRTEPVDRGASVMSLGAGTEQVQSYRYTKRDAPSSSVYVEPSDVTNVVDDVVSPIGARTALINVPDGNVTTCATRDGSTVKDFRVQIGENTRNDGRDGDHAQSVTIGRDSHTHGSASTSVGPNAECGTNGFNVAIGWRTAAIGPGAIAIGTGTKSGENYFVDDDQVTHNPNEQSAAAVGAGSIVIGRGTRAEYDDGIAIGRNAKSNAKNAIQLGQGTNNESGTIKFGSTTIVRDGKVVNTDAGKAEPNVITNLVNDSVSVDAGNTYTLLPDSGLNEGSEIGFTPTGTRNYTVYIPNEEETREGMPCWLNHDMPDSIKVVYKGITKGMAYKFPVKMSVTQPYSKLVIIESEYLDDGWDWTPVITNVNYRYNSNTTSPKLIVPDGLKWTMQGTSMHAATKIRISYTSIYNRLAAIDITGETNTGLDGTVFLQNTFYKGCNLAREVDLTAPIKIDGDKVSIDVEYITVNGTCTNTFDIPAL